MTLGAILSEDGKYRYQPTRTWDASRPVVTFVMLNPSTADAATDDPTIRKCVGFAKHWGCGGIAVGNLFTFRETSPVAMKRAKDPIGPDNWDHLKALCCLTDMIFVAWGTNGNFQHQDDRFYLACKYLWKRSPRVLRLTAKTKMPEHPLYVPYNVPTQIDPRFAALP